jgi:heterodisulfide reductase subunit A
MDSPAKATAKAKDLIRMVVAKSFYLEPLYSISLSVNNDVLVLGGGMGGMTAALGLADQGFKVNLIEREDILGGNLRNIYFLNGNVDPQKELIKVIDRISGHANIKVWTGAKAKEVEGFIGNFKTIIEQNGNTTEIEHGVVIVATGVKQYLPDEYNYGMDKRVITQCKLEQSLINKEFTARRVVMIQCVGSREGERMYCSRICCSQAIKNSIKIKENNPDTDVYILYREIRTYGFREKYYTKARVLGVKFVRYNIDRKPSVSTVSSNGSDRLQVEVRDHILKDTLLIDCDLLVLAPAIIPQDDAEDVAKMLKVPLTKERFFLEAHMKLRPVDFSTAGIFLAGMAHSPKSIDETIAQAEATAGRAATIISKTEYIPEAIVSSVDEEICAGCGICAAVCSYDASEIVTIRGRRIARFNKALCKGCGACAAACPSGAVQQLGFRPKQIANMISSVLEI